MHNIEPTIWNFWKSTGNQTLLTAAFIATHFKKNARLSELRVCSCDPAKCVFSNGVKGPLLNKDDIYANSAQIHEGRREQIAGMRDRGEM